MTVLRSLMLVLCLFAFTACEKADADSAANVQDLDGYYASIDYSCRSASDCAIKDIHNCCGYFPACVNSATEVSPEKVSEYCAAEELAGVCGFPTISACACVNSRCEGKEIGDVHDAQGDVQYE